MATRPFGKIRTLKSGRYQASYIRDGQRRFAPITFTHRADARSWLDQRRAEIERDVLGES